MIGLQAASARRQKLSTALAAMQGRDLTHAWRSWLEFLLSRRRKQHLLQTAISRFVNSRMHAAFSTWKVSGVAC